MTRHTVDLHSSPVISIDTDNQVEERPLLTGDDVKDRRDNEHKVGVGLSIFNLACAAIGGGVLGFPYAYKSTGLVAGVILTFFLLFFMARSLVIIGTASRLSKQATYQGIVTTFYGRRWAVFTEVVSVLYLFGSCVAYMSIVGDTGTVTIEHWFGDRLAQSMPFVAAHLRESVIVFFSIVIIFPLSCFKRLDWLAPVCFLAVASVVYLAALVAVSGLETLRQHPVPPQDLRITWNFFAGIPIICFAYQCHVQAPVIYASLRDSTATRINYVILGAMLLCSIMYIPTGVFGLITFGPNTAGDVLNSYSASDIGALVGRVLMGVHVMLAYPINSHPCRIALSALLFRTEDPRGFRFWVLTVGLFSVKLLAATFVPDVTDVFGLMGSTFAVLWIFLFPAAFLWTNGGKDHLCGRIEVFLMYVLGAFFAITGTVETMKDMIH